MSTRPRITFDERGWCNACRRNERKKTLDLSSRQAELDRLLNKYQRHDGRFYNYKQANADFSKVFE